MTTRKPGQPRRRRRGPQDGVFQKPNGWWYLDYYDSEGRRHRTKASMNYEAAKALYRKKRVELDRGELTGIRDKGLLFERFAKDTWLPLTQARVNALWGEYIAQRLAAAAVNSAGCSGVMWT